MVDAMAACRNSVSSNELIKGAKNNGKNSKQKSLAFVPLDGLSQSEKDRRMNERTVKPPKNLNLIEGDPVDDMEFPRRRHIETFPNEHFLSSKIKEVNGMDYSNHFIEQHYRHCHSRSVSPEISEVSTNSSSLTNDSTRSDVRQEETHVLNISNLAEVENSNTESDLAADCSDANRQEYKADDLDYDSHFIDAEEMEDYIRNCRYSKNAAIIGLLKNKIISPDDLETDIENKMNLYSEDDPQGIPYALNNRKKKILGNKKDIDQEFDSNVNKIAAYPHLVPHPEDPEFFTHPLQAYGEVDDSEIDFRLPRLGQKTVMTPRQYFISEGLNDEKFTFQRKTADVPKPKFNISFEKINRPRSPLKENNYNTASVNAYNSSTNDEDDKFKLNHNEFPTLKR